MCVLDFRGQSAIEYLMTYGWMLLVVAVVGGAVFSVVGDQSVKSVSGFSGSDVQIEKFGVAENGFEAELRSAASEKIENVEVRLVDSETGEEASGSIESSVPVTGTESVEILGVEHSDSANTYDVVIDYDRGGLTNLQVQGSLTDNLEFIPYFSAPDCGEVSYSGSGTSSEPYKVSNVYQLQCMGNSSSGVSLTDYYELTNDIDASTTENWNDGKGFDPVGRSFSSNFSGTMEANMHQIRGMHIERDDRGQVGLFGVLDSDASVRNLQLSKPNVSGDYNVGVLSGYTYGDLTGIHISEAYIQGDDVGGLSGYSDGSEAQVVIEDSSVDIELISSGAAGGITPIMFEGNIINSSVQGFIAGDNLAGGVVGELNDGEILNSSSTADVEGSGEVGGLVGAAYTNTNLTSSYSKGQIISDGGYAGGIIGDNYGLIQESYSSGDVIAGGNYAGGVSGFDEGEIVSSYATGDVEGDWYVGGLSGFSGYGGEIIDSYARGDVNAEGGYGGGAIGWFGFSGADINRSYSTGEVSGGADIGGLIGYNEEGSTNYSYWDTESSGQSSSDGGTDLTTSEMQGSSAETNIDGFDFTNIWDTVSGDYPELAWQE